MSKLLPVVNSAAASTAFAAEQITSRNPPYRSLYLDGNGKITAGNGTLVAPSPNAFSLVQVEDCPGSTPTCRSSCYVHQLEGAARNVHDLYRHNSCVMREILTDPNDYRWFAGRLATWINERAKGGFRWHVSGDLFSAEYAGWIAEIVKLSPGVRHWIYTRSFAFSAAFVAVPNITINYSVDRDNYESARPYVEAHAGIGEPVRLCYMVTGDGYVPADLPEGSVLFPDYALRAAHAARASTPAEQREGSAWWQSLTSAQRRMVCPVDFYGATEKRRCGPCSKCIDPVAS